MSNIDERLRERGIDGPPTGDRLRSLAATLWRDLRSDETTPRPIDEHVREAVDWLFASQDATATAGSAACYNLVLGWGDPYPETSGYVVPTLYDVGDQYDCPEAARRAERMARWLREVQLPSGAFPAGTYSGDETEPSVFNTGQILRGLTRAYRETGDEQYAESAVAAIDWLAAVQRSDGSWDEHDYNAISHAYSSRISWPVLEAARTFDVDDGERVAAANLRWVLDQQTANGWFEKCSFERGNAPFLHTIAYTVRGLLEGSRFLDGDLGARCEQAGLRTARRLLDEQRRRGILRGAYDRDWTPVGDYHCLTGNAQMAVVWARAQTIDGDREYTDGVCETVRFLRRTHTVDGPTPIRGGIRGSDPVWGSYMYLRYPNWACKFFIDALLRAESLCDHS